MTDNALQTEALSPEDIAAILADAGAIDEEGETFYRLKVDGSNFVGNDDIWMSNPKTGEAAFTARILANPVQFQAMWFQAAKDGQPSDAVTYNRPDMEGGGYCKSYYDNPAEAREVGTYGASCRSCMVNPFQQTYRPKCGWKGDLQLQIIPEDGVMKGDEVVQTLTFSTTGMIQWRGTKKSPSGGSVEGTNNFQFLLAQLALAKAPEWGLTAKEAITAALTSLVGGGVAAEFRIHRVTNEEAGNTWSVPAATPVHIELLTPESTPKVEAGDSLAGDVPF
jgi:hypothetical protein